MLSFFNISPTILRMALAQGLSMTVMNVNIINTGLVGSILAPTLWMATLPLSLLFVAVMLASLPASLLMARFGRRPIFLAGVIISVIATLMQAAAIIFGDFSLFVIGSILLGISHGTAQFYRYAAADAVPISEKPKAISYVLLGGLMAAIIGPEIAFRLVDVIEGAKYAGSFLGATAVQLLAFLVLARLSIAPPEKQLHQGRSIRVFFTMKGFRLGLIIAGLGYAVMSFLMTATPIQIVNVSYLGIEENVRVIQWHVIAMFAPSFFTGSLISRYGIKAIAIAGLIFYLMCVGFALLGTGFWHYFIALFMLGLGWNFLYVSGSALIASMTKPSERGRVQGVCDLIIFSTVAGASLSAGIFHSVLGWQGLVQYCLIPVGVMGLAILLTSNAALKTDMASEKR